MVLPKDTVAQLIAACENNEGYRLTIDLQNQVVITPDNEKIAFEVDEFRKYCLLEGLDDIGLTLSHADDIRAYEERRRTEVPWQFF